MHSSLRRDQRLLQPNVREQGLALAIVLFLLAPPVASSQSVPWQAGFDFRATQTFVNDPANNFVLGAGTPYPSTANGVTFGWTNNPSLKLQTRNRNASLDPRLAGINFVPNNVAPAVFRVDLPSAGTYGVRLALGDASYAQCSSGCRVELRDGNTSLFALTVTGLAAGQFADANGNVWSAANWPSSNNQRSITMSGTQLTVLIGANDGITDNTTLAFFGISALAVSSNFTISASPTAVSVVSGNSVTSAVTTTALGGFGSAVALSASGVPNGVTVSFNPPSITGAGTSIMTMTASSAAVPGSSTITVAATSGSLQHTTTVGVTVAASSQPRGILYVAGKTANQIYVWDAASTASGSASPTHTILSAPDAYFHQSISRPQGLFINSAGNQLYSVNTNSPIGMSMFDTASAISGAVHPATQLFGLNLAFSLTVSGVAMDTARNVLYLTEQGKVRVWNNASTVTGDTVQSRTITGLTLPEGIFDDAGNDRLYVADFSAPNISIYNHASTANGAVSPSRKLSGLSSRITSPAGVAVDSSRNVLYATDGNTNSILIWKNASTVNGNIAPTAVITGANTQISSPCHLALDTSRDELYVGSYSTVFSKVLVFSGVSQLSGNQDLAPSRIITVPSTSPCGVAIDVTRTN